MRNHKTPKQEAPAERGWKPWGDHPVIVTIVVVVAVLGLAIPFWQTEREVKYAGRVMDSKTQAPIRSAKVTLDIQGAPPIAHTDSEGIFIFPLVLSSESVTGRIRVDAEGYDNYDRNITLSSNRTQLEDIRLIPALATSPSPTVTASSAAGGSSQGAATPAPALLPTAATPGPPTPIPAGQWQMEYFTNPKLDAPSQGSLAFPAEENNEEGYALLYRSEERRPTQPIPANNWSARFIGRFQFEAGRYAFHCGHNDGCRVFVGSKNIIDAWWDGDGGHDQEIDLSSGTYTVRIEFYDKSGYGHLDVWWKKVK
jgi:hypothetical protein